MDTIILSIDDIRAIIQQVGLHELMDDLISRLTIAFQEYDEENTTIPVRDGFNYHEPHIGLIEWMPVMETGKAATIKIVGYHPTNPALRKLPTILSTISAYDTSSGHLIGLADATFLTALRTGAASAVASKLMASPDSQTVGLIGCGAQAVTQLHALTREFGIHSALAYDIDAGVSNHFADRVDFLDVDVRTTDLKTLVREADIIVTATSVGIGHGPVFSDEETKPWLHINAVGADFPGKVEIPASFLKKSFVCPDFLEQALKEGECQQLATGDIGPELVTVVQNAQQYTFVQQQRSVFDSTGWALEDQVALNMMLDYAEDLGLGKLIQLESISADPHDPYHFVKAKTQVHQLTSTGVIIESP